MAYVDPNLVKSPKGRVDDLHVLHDSGEGGFSIAEMTWDGKPGAVGARWNGGDGEGMGNPQSRGIPTWFILPEPLANWARDADWKRETLPPVSTALG